ncbi:MAG: hypothetical protein ACXQTD_00150 [Candidatus Syntropharchaeia archaeon]
MSEKRLHLKKQDKAPGVWGTEIRLRNADAEKVKKLIGKLKKRVVKSLIKQTEEQVQVKQDEEVYRSHRSRRRRRI